MSTTSHLAGAVARAGRRARLLAAAVGAVAALAMLPSTASAQCNPGDFCMWRHGGFSGDMYHFAGRDPDLTNNIFSYFPKLRRVSDNASTIWNNGVITPGYPAYVMAHKDINYGGPAFCVPPNTGYHLWYFPVPWDTDRGWAEGSYEPDGTWNDDISSFRWTWAC
jgi:hypothetical protein